MKSMTLQYMDTTGQVKSIDFTHWGGIDGFLSASNVTGDQSVTLRRACAWYARMIAMIANDIASLPFDIIDETGEVYDSSADWQNRLGGIPNPRAMINKLASSLAATGRAYLIPTMTSRAMTLQYVTPWSVTAQYDSAGRLIEFYRIPGGRYTPDKIVYFLYPDDTVEQDGMPVVYPGATASLPASILAAMDGSLHTWGERGFVPPTILSAKGMPDKAEREKAEKWWNAFLRGWTKTVAKIVNAEVLTPVKIGNGGEELRGTYIQIKRQLIEDIGAAGGIPSALFMSNAANYATAQVDRQMWYQSGEFTAIWQTIQEVMTSQVLKRYGMRWQFNLQAVTTQDEADSTPQISSIVPVLVDSPNTTLAVARYMGWEISDKDMQTMLQAVQTDNESRPEPAPVAQPASTAPTEDAPDMEDETEPEDAPDMPDEENEDENNIADEMMKWAAFERKHAGKAHRDFECKYIPARLQVRIRAALKSGADIDATFAQAAQDIPAIVLANAINRLANG